MRDVVLFVLGSRQKYYHCQSVLGVQNLEHGERVFPENFQAFSKRFYAVVPLSTRYI